MFGFLYCSPVLFSAVEQELEEPRSRNEYVLPSHSTAKTNTWLQYKKPKIQAPGTTFLTFSDKVRYEGGHETCCRFGTLTGLHQGAHIRSDKFCPARNGRARAGKRNVLGKKTAADVRPLALWSGRLAISALLYGQCNTGVPPKR